MDIVSYIKSFPTMSFSKNEVIASSGDPNETLFAVRDGFIKIASVDETGREKLLWIAGRYDTVPIERFFSKRPISYFYSGFSDGSAYIIDKAKLLGHSNDTPMIMEEIARGLSEHYDDLLMRMNAVEQSDIRSKLLHVIYNIALKFSSSEIIELHAMGLNLTHQNLADMIGSTREAVSIEMAKLRKASLIEYSRSTFIVHRDALKAAIETPA